MTLMPRKLNTKIKILIILLALCAVALGSPIPTTSAPPGIGFTPMVDWHCTIDVTTDRIVLVDAKTGDYLASASLSTVLPPASGAQSGQDRSSTPDQLRRAALSFSRTVIDKITPPDNTFLPMIQGGYTFTNGHFETTVQVDQRGAKWAMTRHCRLSGQLLSRRRIFSNPH